jgi:hypothetical protein
MLSIGATPLSAVAEELLWAMFTKFIYRTNICGLISKRSDHHRTESVCSFRTMLRECRVGTDVNLHTVSSELNVASHCGRFISSGKYTNSVTGWI